MKSLSWLVVVLMRVGFGLLDGGTCQAAPEPPAYGSAVYLEFSDPEYTVWPGETNAVISVLRSGEFRIPVTVGFAAQDGSGRAGEDYVATEGTLTIPPGVGMTNFVVPILSSPGSTNPAMVRLILFNAVAGCLITRAEATLSIWQPPSFTNTVPSLSLHRDAKGRVVINWPAAHRGCVLEKTPVFQGASWTAVEAAPDISEGVCTLVESETGSQSFYRLRTR